MNEQVSVEPGTTEPGQAALQALQEEGTETFDQTPEADAEAEAISVTGETALDEHGGLYGAPSTEGAAPVSLKIDALRPAEKVVQSAIVNEGTTIEAQDELSTDNHSLSEMAGAPLPPNDEVKPETSDPLPQVGEVSIPEDASRIRSDGTLREKQIQGFHDKVSDELDDDIEASEKKLDDRLNGNIPEEPDSIVVQKGKALTDAFIEKVEKAREPMPESMAEKLLRLKQERESLRGEAQQRRDVLSAELNAAIADRDKLSAEENERHKIEIAKIDGDSDARIQSINEELAEIERILGEA